MSYRTGNSAPLIIVPFQPPATSNNTFTQPIHNNSNNILPVPSNSMPAFPVRSPMLPAVRKTTYFVDHPTISISKNLTPIPVSSKSSEITTPNSLTNTSSLTIQHGAQCISSSQPVRSQPGSFQAYRYQPVCSQASKSQYVGSHPGSFQVYRYQPVGSQAVKSQYVGSQPVGSQSIRSQFHNHAKISGQVSVPNNVYGDLISSKYRPKLGGHSITSLDSVRANSKTQVVPGKKLGSVDSSLSCEPCSPKQNKIQQSSDQQSNYCGVTLSCSGKTQTHVSSQLGCSRNNSRIAITGSTSLFSSLSSTEGLSSGKIFIY